MWIRKLKQNVPQASIGVKKFMFYLLIHKFTRNITTIYNRFNCTFKTIH